MAIKKIPCGGFSYDDTEISFENGVIHPIGGGGGGAMVVTVDYEQSGLTADKTYEEIWEAASNGVQVLAAVRTNGRTAYVLSMQQATPIDGVGVTYFGVGWVVDGEIKSTLMVDSYDRWEIGTLD